LCGHSERRRDHHETERQVARKAHAAVAAGLTALVCVGETLEERASGLTRGILARQLEAVLAEGPPGDFAIAYEPVWAIGTGRVATPDMVEEAHETIRSVVLAVVGHEVAERTRILYGGSAKPDNVAALAALDGVDGFLVGGASLDAASFLAIIANSPFGD
jgi:triosephosphate isomerase